MEKEIVLRTGCRSGVVFIHWHISMLLTWVVICFHKYMGEYATVITTEAIYIFCLLGWWCVLLRKINALSACETDGCALLEIALCAFCLRFSSATETDVTFVRIKWELLLNELNLTHLLKHGFACDDMSIEIPLCVSGGSEDSVAQR